jgi:hypothetical protein
MARGKPVYLPNSELVEYIFVDLGSVVIARHTPISISELYSQLPAFETRRALMNNEGGTSVNSASRGCDGLGHGGGRDPSIGGGRGGFSVAASTTAMAALVVVATAPSTNALHARCIRSGDIPQTGASIGLMRIMCQRTGLQRWLLVTEVGIRILELLIT